ncbi:MAG: hypothetical protein NXI31_11365 [bacterium]|nr:hypothetical protein [bacterium]
MRRPDANVQAERLRVLAETPKDVIVHWVEGTATVDGYQAQVATRDGAMCGPRRDTYGEAFVDADRLRIVARGA